MKRNYTYFGFIDFNINFEENFSKIYINNNFSSYLIEFQIKGIVEYTKCILNDCIFIFTETDLYAFKEQNEANFY